jgi:FHA domain/Transcriptional regulatory protein, C terminal
MTCAVCKRETATNLCDACASELDVPVPFVAEQILSAAVAPQEAVLVDIWGRVHPVEQRTSIGRTPTARGISILHASVSRRHAILELVGDVWTIEDLGSSNGTRVNEELVTRATLHPGDRVTLGAVGLYVAVDDGHRVTLEPDELASRTLKSDARDRPARGFEAEATSAGLPEFAIALVEAPAGGGGYLEAANERLQLSTTQYAMLEMLMARMRAQADVSELVRGFVPSGQLIADLPWDASDPDESHLKQLVRRMRRALDTIRLGGLIESRRGFGYRLRVIPR